MIAISRGVACFLFESSSNETLLLCKSDAFVIVTGATQISPSYWIWCGALTAVLLRLYNFSRSRWQGSNFQGNPQKEVNLCLAFALAMKILPLGCFAYKFSVNCSNVRPPMETHHGRNRDLGALKWAYMFVRARG